MNGMERYAGLSDHDLILITVTKLDGLEKKVGEQMEKLCAQDKELRLECGGLSGEVEDLKPRVSALEATRTWTLWVIGGVAGACVALALMLAEHALGG